MHKYLMRFLRDRAGYGVSHGNMITHPLPGHVPCLPPFNQFQPTLDPISTVPPSSHSVLPATAACVPK